MTDTPLDYATAGVDTAAGDRAVELMKSAVAATHDSTVLGATGGSERHSLVIDHALRPLFSYMGAFALPTGVYAATSDFGGEGAAALERRIERAAGELRTVLAGNSIRKPKVDQFADFTPFDQLLGSIG